MPLKDRQYLPEKSDGRLWLRGASALGKDVFTGSVNIVHGIQQAVTATVARFNPGAYAIGRYNDFIYARVKDVGSLGFFAISQGVGLAEALRPGRAAHIPQRTALGLRSALNGAFGDYLEGADNDLAVPMSLVDGDGHRLSITHSGLSVTLAEAQPRLVVFLHGLGLNDQQWQRRGGPDFGQRMEAELGYTALRLRYNSGRHISHNGRDFAGLLQDLFDAYPVPIERLTIIGHSMGGLVARSACHYAGQAGHSWVDALDDLVCLGAPHLGAPLARLGNWVTRNLTLTPYTEPLSTLGRIRSAGVKDLRYGYLLDDDWQQAGPDDTVYTPSRALPMLDHVGYFLVAATLGRSHDDPLGRWLGDLLVPVQSAVGHSPVPSRRLPTHDQDGRVFYGMSHFALMYHDDVYAAIRDWLAPRLAQQTGRAH